jgi:CheY-like chemotaxis protein
MSGFEVARQLREINRTPRPLIVAVTGWGKLEDELRGREAGFDLHLMKPIEGEHLHRVFEQMSATRH